MHTQVMVLNDGETYTSLAGCKVMWLPALESELNDNGRLYGTNDEDTFVKENFDNPKYTMLIEEVMKSAMIRVERTKG